MPLFVFTKKKLVSIFGFKNPRGTWLAHSVEHSTHDLGVVGLSPTLGVGIA